MIVLCTGGESCGTRLAARLVEQMGGESIHRSFPHAQNWPDLSEFEFDRAVLMTRDWWAVIPSQLAHHPVDSEVQAEGNLRNAYAVIPAQLQALGKPWRFVSYEALVQNPGPTIKRLANWLCLDPSGVTEPIRNGNEKWE